MTNENRKNICLIVIALLLFSMVFVSGCVEQQRTSIKNEQQVGEAVTNISQNIEDVSSILTDIDKKLG
ncbi:MAG: hypothetical protein J4469_03935 [Candidatus Aenigmarchaeota archaeon]|nr:hypothetical protein [Candidatus Aenigmarchaeota archaeon]